MINQDSSCWKISTVINGGGTMIGPNRLHVIRPQLLFYKLKFTDIYRNNKYLVGRRTQKDLNTNHRIICAYRIDYASVDRFIKMKLRLYSNKGQWLWNCITLTQTCEIAMWNKMWSYHINRPACFANTNFTPINLDGYCHLTKLIIF